MGCCGQCQGIEQLFDQQQAQSDLDEYRRHGPARQTRLLLDALREAGVNGLTLLDIGGGVGAIQHDLLANGAREAVDVDASSAYLAAAKSEAARRGQADRARYLYGDFVSLAPEIEVADVVTLDRVLCCYHDMPALVRLSAARARRLYGLVFPLDTWWTRLGVAVMNLYLRLRRSPFRTFIHSTADVETLLRQGGLERRYYRRAGVWQVMVYERRGSIESSGVPL